MDVTRAGNFVQQFFDFDGTPLSGGYVCTYLAGTTDPEPTYKDDRGTLNKVEIELDSRGECDMWLDPRKKYRIILRRSDRSVVWTKDNVQASAHVPGIIPFAIDEDHLKLSNVGGTLILSIADSIVSKLKAKGIDIE